MGTFNAGLEKVLAVVGVIPADDGVNGINSAAPERLRVHILRLKFKPTTRTTFNLSHSLEEKEE